MNDYLAFFAGRVRAEAKGNQLEGFINGCHRRNIRLLHLKRIDENHLEFSLARRAFRRLREPAFRSGTRIRILKKSGLFMAIRPFKRRWGLLIGLVLFMWLVYYGSCFVWRVEVKGCKTISSTQITEDLKEYGLSVGCSRKIDVNKMENLYLIGNDKITWISINIRGTTAYVEVREQGVPPKMLNASIPTNIYAQRDGIIRSVNAYGGTPCVTEGQPVLAGDLLVTGDWTDSYGIRRLSHCMATVRAETTRKTQIEIPFQEIQRQKSGNSTKKFELFLGNLRIPLYFSRKIEYNNYNTVFWERSLSVGALALPVRVSCERYDEVKEVSIQRSPEEAQKRAFARLGFYERDVLFGVEILKRELSETSTDEAFILSAEYQCEEEIGVALPIEGAMDAENTEKSG